MDQYAAMVDGLGASAKRLRFANQTGAKRILAWCEILTRWRAEAEFCTFFSASLATVPFEGFFWETPPLVAGGVDLPFECVAISAPALARQRADPTPFAAQFGASGEAREVATFRNLSGDADLIVPYDTGTGANYAHFAAFLRTASTKQTWAVWRAVAEAAEARLARGERIWISTAGLGVAWLHVRIDSRPKYYTHAPYRSFGR